MARHATQDRREANSAKAATIRARVGVVPAERHPVFNDPSDPLDDHLVAIGMSRDDELSGDRSLVPKR